MSTSRIAWKWLIIIVTLVAYPSSAWSFTFDKRQTLRGLTEISVLVEYLPDEIEREGLKREQIQRDIEFRLQEAGLRVLPITEIAAASGSPYLYVNIAMSPGPTINSAIPAISLTFKQLVHLSRTPTTELFTTTWDGPVFHAFSTRPTDSPTSTAKSQTRWNAFLLTIKRSISNNGQDWTGRHLPTTEFFPHLMNHPFQVGFRPVPIIHETVEIIRPRLWYRRLGRR